MSRPVRLAMAYQHRGTITSPPLRKKTCLDCNTEFDGPASAKRCAGCRPAWDLVIRARGNARQKKKRKGTAITGRPPGSVSHA